MRLDYLSRRLIQFLIVLWGAATLNFLVPRLAPGNPVRERLVSAMQQSGPMQQGIEEMVRSYNVQFGLDQPLYIQYFKYMGSALRLDFGYSIAQYPVSVMTLILNALPWTIGLLTVATLLSFTLGTLLGALLAWPRAPRVLHYLVPPLMGLSSIPYYLLGLILVYLLALSVPAFPLTGAYSIGATVQLTPSFAVDVIRHAALPSLSIILAAIGFWALGMRAMMVTTEGEDYMVLAEAKGLRARRIFFRYATRNAILPQFTSLAIQLGHIVSGSVIVEIVFGYPGIGNLLFQAISASDYFVIYGVVFVTVLAITLATLLIDLLYPLLDPRIVYRRG
ncbi:MAG: ABC transporter permease [Chloroflexi bacterium]|nr:ABC transporter permease [Chloroflexota bacterium]MBV9543922.1 ABC transporter permease [Chloroflexota bacterium]